jgi:hypothetical protein
MKNGALGAIFSQPAGERVMRNKTLFAIIIAVACVGSAHSQERSDFVARERIGSLRIGSTEAEVKKGVDCPLKTGEAWKSAKLRPEGDRRLFGPATYHEEWENVPCGIKVGMAGRAGREFTVKSIAVFAPSTLGTARGIRIGSTEEEVMKIYAAEWNKAVDERGKAFLAGSVDRGLIFYFENGRVIRILLRAKVD